MDFLCYRGKLLFSNILYYNITLKKVEKKVEYVAKRSDIIFCS